MNHWYYFVIGLIVGGGIGVIAMGLICGVDSSCSQCRMEEAPKK